MNNKVFFYIVIKILKLKIKYKNGTYWIKKKFKISFYEQKIKGKSTRFGINSKYLNPFLFLPQKYLETPSTTKCIYLFLMYLKC